MSWTCLSDAPRVARKEHKCTWCGQPISPGERYQYSSGVFEGEFVTNSLHPECDKAAQEDYAQTGEGFSPYENERPQLKAKGDQP